MPNTRWLHGFVHPQHGADFHRGRQVRRNVREAHLDDKAQSPEYPALMEECLIVDAEGNARGWVLGSLFPVEPRACIGVRGKWSKIDSPEGASP